MALEARMIITAYNHPVGSFLPGLGWLLPPSLSEHGTEGNPIPRNSSVECEFLKQQAPRLPHIVTFEEEEKLPADRGALFTCVDRPHSGDRHALS